MLKGDEYNNLELWGLGFVWFLWSTLKNLKVTLCDWISDESVGVISILLIPIDTDNIEKVKKKYKNFKYRQFDSENSILYFSINPP